MNLKKALPLILLVVLAAITLFIKQCNTADTTVDVKPSKEETRITEDIKPPSPAVVPKTDTTHVKKE